MVTARDYGVSRLQDLMDVGVQIMVTQQPWKLRIILTIIHYYIDYFKKVRLFDIVRKLIY